MKFLKAEAFEKHLKEALPDHPSSLYGIGLSDPFERQFIIERLVRQIEGEVKWLRVSETPLESFLEELDSPSLFSPNRTLVYDEVDKLKKSTLLQAALKNLPGSAHVILGGNTLRFYEALKQDMVLLDLSSEKPWEKASRLKRWLLQEVQREGKSLTADAAAYLSEFCSSRFESLMQEVKKLVTYVGDNPEIDLKAVREIVTIHSSQKGWQLSEAIVWGGAIHFPTVHSIDSQELYLFLGQLRYQIQLGLVVSSCLEKGEERLIEKHYPKLPGRALDKYKGLAKGLKTPFFRAGLKDLFELELQSRSRSAGIPFLLDHFIAKVNMRRSS